MIECSKTVQDVVLFRLPNQKSCQCGCSAETSGCAHCKFYLCAVCRRYDCWTSSQTEFVRSGSLWAGTSLTFEVTFFETVLPGEWDQCEVAPRQFYSCNAGILLHSLGPFADKLKTLDSTWLWIPYQNGGTAWTCTGNKFWTECELDQWRNRFRSLAL